MIETQISNLVEAWGEPLLSAAFGIAIGVVFGVLAQRSRFCMRSAVVETWRGKLSDRLPLWLLALGVAMAVTQAAIFSGLVKPADIRLLSGSVSFSGAAVGGLLFGAGMILSRGCVSRLMVLAASGNVRALVTGLAFIAVAYATMKGALGPARAFFASFHLASGPDNLDVLKMTGLGPAGGAALGAGLIALALVIGGRHHLTWRTTTYGVAIGLVVAGSYAITALLNGASFDPQPVRGLSFIAPTVNAISTILATVASLDAFKLDFDLGLIPGVFIGALIAALAARDFTLQFFHNGLSVLRYLAGAALMGFGGVLAGGCSMGNGVSGSAVLAAPALIALAGMWLGAGVTDALIDRPGARKTTAAADGGLAARAAKA